MARRKTRLAKLAEARAKERFEHEQAEYQAKLAARKAKAEATRKKPSGKPPQPPAEGPLATDQINLTDEATTPRRWWWRTACWWWPPMWCRRQQLEPMVEKLKALPEELGQVETLLADNGYFSAVNVTTCEAANRGNHPLWYKWPAYARRLAVALAGHLPTAPTPLSGTRQHLPHLRRAS